MLYALIMTVVIEGIVLLALGESEPLFYLYWTALTTFTNVGINLTLFLVSIDSRTVYAFAVAALELLVLTVEMLFAYLYKKSLKKSIIYSVVCNAASFFLGGTILLFF